MSDAALAEPPATTELILDSDTPPNTEGIMEPGFGNLSDAFDRAFPSTAKKPEAEPPPAPAPEVVAPPSAEPKAEPAVAVPESKPDSAQTVPEAIFGDNKVETQPPAAEPKIEVPAHIKDPKQIKNFEQMRDLYETTKRERAREATEFTRQLAEAKATAVDPGVLATIEQLKKQNQELLQFVERKSVEDHPRFKQEITLPLNQARKEAHQVLEYAQVDPKQFDKAMNLQGASQTEALNDIYERLPESAKAELAASVLQIRRLDARKDDILKNASGTAQKLQQQDTITRHEQLQQQEQKTLATADAVEAYLRDDLGIEAFKKSDDPKDQWWNDEVEKRRTKARAILTKETDPSQHAFAAHLAAACPFYRDFALSKVKEVNALKAELAAIKGAEPRLDGGGDVPNPAPEDDKLTFAESVARGSGLR